MENYKVQLVHDGINLTGKIIDATSFIINREQHGLNDNQVEVLEELLEAMSEYGLALSKAFDSFGWPSEKAATHADS